MKCLIENKEYLKIFHKFWLKNKKKDAVGSKGAYQSKYRCFEKQLIESKTIIFYEWSNLYGTKKYFLNLKDLYTFFEESKIPFPTYSITNKFEEKSELYVVCKPNSTTLLVEESFEKLEAEFNKVLQK